MDRRHGSWRSRSTPSSPRGRHPRRLGCGGRSRSSTSTGATPPAPGLGGIGGSAAAVERDHGARQPGEAEHRDRPHHRPRARDPLPAGRDVRRVPHQQAAVCGAKLRIDVGDIRGPTRTSSTAGVRATAARAGRRPRRLRLLGFWARPARTASSRPSSTTCPASPPGARRLDRRHVIAGGIAAALFHREQPARPRSWTCPCWRRACGRWARRSRSPSASVIAAVHRPRGSAPLNPLIGLLRHGGRPVSALCMLQGFHYWPEVCASAGTAPTRRPIPGSRPTS